MLSIVSPILLVMALVFSLFSKQWHRFFCVVMIVMPTAIHYYFFNESTGAVYYGSAMAFSAMAIALLQLIKPNEKPSQLVVHLQVISFLFLIVNFIGYFIWYAYMPPTWYNSLCLVLAVIEAARLIIHTDGDKQDGIDGRYYNWNFNATKRRMGSGG